jgi:hypothetical protein
VKLFGATEMMDYRVITATGQYQLKEQVIEMIKLGWRPQGGVSFVYHSAYKETWAQAMVKDE